MARAATETVNPASPYERRGAPSSAPQRGSSIVDQFGNVVPATDDPAWQPPRDPLAGARPSAVAGLIHREIPLTTVQHAWSIDDVRGALADLTIGRFDQASQLVDAVMGDDRVQATWGSRTGGLYGRPVRHELATGKRVANSSAARECRDAWAEAWPRMMTDPVLGELSSGGLMLGLGPGQILWDTSSTVWLPHVQPWNPRYVYYHWTFRCYVASTLDGIVPLTPGDGHWVVHAPNGMYRGWMHGAVRALAQPWFIRTITYRDWARYSERHGFPIVLAKTPSAGDPTMAAKFRNALAELGQESVVELPQGVEPQFSYGLELLEAKDTSWEGFAQLIDRCDMSIVLTLLHQNLTTEVKEGSFAAARVHADVRQSALESDARRMERTIYEQIARPFALFNFGDAELAPSTSWELDPYEDNATSAQTLNAMAQAVATLKNGGFQVGDLVALAKSFGLHLTAANIERAAEELKDVA